MVMVKNCKLETARLRDPGFKIRDRDLKTPKRTESPRKRDFETGITNASEIFEIGPNFDDVFLALTVKNTAFTY